MAQPQENNQDHYNQSYTFPCINSQIGNYVDFQQNDDDIQAGDLKFNYNYDDKNKNPCDGSEFPKIANQRFEFAKVENQENDYFKENFNHKNSYQSYDTFSETAYSYQANNQNQNSPYVNQIKGPNGENCQDQGSFLTQLKIDDISYDNNNLQHLQIKQQNQYPNQQQSYGQSTFQSLSSEYDETDNNLQQNEYQQPFQQQQFQDQFYDQPFYQENINNQFMNNNINQYQYQQQQQQQINDYNNNYYIDNNNRQQQQQQNGRILYKSNSLQVEPTKIRLQRQSKTCIFGQNNSLSSSNSPFDQVDLPYNENYDMSNNNKFIIKQEENPFKNNNNNSSNNNMIGQQEYQSLKNVLKYPKSQNDARNYLNKLQETFFPLGSIDTNLFKEKNLQILSRKKTTENKEETQRFRNMKKLIMNGILKYFQPEILSRCSQIPPKIRENIVEIANQIRQAGKSTSEKNKYMDLFSQPHFNLIFLSLNKESCHCMSKNKMNINLHKQVFKFDISKFDNSLETQEKVEYINVLKNFMYLVAKQFLEKDGEHEQSVVTEYKQIVLNSLDKMIVGHYINKFSSYKQLQQKNSDSDIYVE